MNQWIASGIPSVETVMSPPGSRLGKTLDCSICMEVCR